MGWSMHIQNVLLYRRCRCTNCTQNTVMMVNNWKSSAKIYSCRKAQSYPAATVFSTSMCVSTFPSFFFFLILLYFFCIFFSLSLLRSVISQMQINFIFIYFYSIYDYCRIKRKWKTVHYNLRSTKWRFSYIFFFCCFSSFSLCFSHFSNIYFAFFTFPFVFFLVVVYSHVVCGNVLFR